MVLLQVVAELRSFEEFEGPTHAGTESLKIRSCSATWRKPLQNTQQMKILVSSQRLPLPTCTMSRGNAKEPVMEQDCQKACPALPIGQTPINMQIE